VRFYQWTVVGQWPIDRKNLLLLLSFSGDHFRIHSVFVWMQQSPPLQFVKLIITLD
jgi:hypothetical protein